MNNQAIKYLETVARESVWPHVRQRAEQKIIEIKGRQIRVVTKTSRARYALERIRSKIASHSEYTAQQNQ